MHKMNVTVQTDVYCWLCIFPPPTPRVTATEICNDYHDKGRHFPCPGGHILTGDMPEAAVHGGRKHAGRICLFNAVSLGYLISQLPLVLQTARIYMSISAVPCAFHSGLLLNFQRKIPCFF